VDGIDARWEAVMRRDPAADGKFFYAVSTTGVFCRPSCPSRRPRREHVGFHASASDAERAGFRPCRRCRPTEAPLDVRRREAVAAACRAIEASEVAPSLDELAAGAGVSRFHFHRLFKATTGVTPRAYALAQRAARVRRALTANARITDAIYDAGFGSAGPFYAAANRTFGMTPSAFRAGGLGTSIRYGVGRCSLGSILVAASERGVCAIWLGDDANALVAQLAERFPHASLAAPDEEFEQWMAVVVRFVDEARVDLDLPLDIQGTLFQQRVWRAPAGTTVTYADVARAIGAPASTRAVARACAANNLAVAIPCHRVVRSDGSLSGYRWGVDRKQALLARESIQAGLKACATRLRTVAQGFSPASARKNKCHVNRLRS
jgi:AraC family transcriptional regulator of adaptative response/methylated-DNA-[protein]-cysteine methyltransferase